MDEGGQPENIIDVEEIPQHGEETPHVDGGLGGEQEIDPNRKSKGKRTYDEKETLFEMCTKSVSEDEAAEEFVDMHHYFLTRIELQCVNPRAWINNKLMSMVAKTLVADQLENGGVVHKHIFTADFMDKMISAEGKWTVESNVAEILPEHVGYNIGDCFLFGPTLFLNHWFCYVLDTRTMIFYALDSLVKIITYYGMQYEMENPTQLATKKKEKKKTELDKAKEFMANKVRTQCQTPVYSSRLGPDPGNVATPRLSEDKVKQCVDPKLNNEYPPKAVAKLAAVAALCVQYEADFRPNMTIVVKALQPLLNTKPAGPESDP
ncbi:hypothetical protein K1719_000351 [Acacia pycnantha]|nr:hypothetical protein K1719_000351 [Acacia pycnantha]